MDRQKVRCFFIFVLVFLAVGVAVGVALYFTGMLDKDEGSFFQHPENNSTNTTAYESAANISQVYYDPGDPRLLSVTYDDIVMTLSGTKDPSTMSVTSIDSLESNFHNGTNFTVNMESGLLFSQVSSTEGFSMNLDWTNISAVKMAFFVDIKSDYAKRHNLTKSFYNHVVDLSNHTEGINFLRGLHFLDETNRRKRSAERDNCTNRYTLRTERCGYYSDSVPEVSGVLHFDTDVNDFTVPTKGHVIRPEDSCYTGPKGPTRYIQIPKDSRTSNKEKRKKLKKTILNSVERLCDIVSLKDLGSKIITGGRNVKTLGICGVLGLLMTGLSGPGGIITFRVCYGIATFLETFCTVKSRLDIFTFAEADNQTPFELFLDGVVDMVNPQLSYSITLDLKVSYPWTTYTRTIRIKYKSTKVGVCDVCGPESYYNRMLTFVSYGPAILLSPPVAYTSAPIYDAHWAYNYYWFMMKIEFTCAHTIWYTKTVPFKFTYSFGSNTASSGFIQHKNIYLARSHYFPHNNQPKCMDFHVLMYDTYGNVYDSGPFTICTP